MTIPWGDVTTAWQATGIGNIQVFVPTPPWLIWAAKAGNVTRPLMSLPAIQRYLKSLVDRRVKGPDEQTRARLTTHVWGEARNGPGEQRVIRLPTAHGYPLPVDLAPLHT